MIFRNAELYNVSELEACRGGYSMLRYPKSVIEKCSEGAQRLNHSTSGVEIRFNLAGDSAEITLSCAEENADSFCLVYYGGTGAGWQNCIKYIHGAPTKIIIPRCDKEYSLKKASELFGCPYDPMLVRVLFKVGNHVIYDIKGDITPPKEGQTPKLKYLAYGSSITHGSLGILPVNTYAYLTAHQLGADLRNLGLAGAAFLEPAVADYIASRDDYDFCTLEMGINILGIEPLDYRTRVMNMIKTVASAHPNKKVFCIDVFYCEDDLVGGGRAECFRKIMRECVCNCGLDNAIYVNGLEMLTGAYGLSGDMVHPNIEGCREISDNLAAFIKTRL